MKQKDAQTKHERIIWEKQRQKIKKDPLQAAIDIKSKGKSACVYACEGGREREGDGGQKRDVWGVREECARKLKSDVLQEIEERCP